MAGNEINTPLQDGVLYTLLVRRLDMTQGLVKLVCDLETKVDVLKSRDFQHILRVI